MEVVRVLHSDTTAVSFVVFESLAMNSAKECAHSEKKTTKLLPPDNLHQRRVIHIQHMMQAGQMWEPTLICAKVILQRCECRRDRRERGLGVGYVVENSEDYVVEEFLKAVI